MTTPGFLRRLFQRDGAPADPASAAVVRFDAWDVTALAVAWRTARPFSHVIIDNLVSAEALSALRRAMLMEPHTRNRGEIFDMLGSKGNVSQPALRALQDALASEQGLAAIKAITGKIATRVVMRSFTYVDGSYLLPHTDHREEIRRLIAYAYYIDTSGTGGDLELFDCTASGDELTDVRPGVRIPAINNRIVLFEVTPTSLHQVHEVIGGTRFSVSGWYYQ